ncbi:DUF433 domain-containing protein [Methylomagnum sp.]
MGRAIAKPISFQVIGQPQRTRRTHMTSLTGITHRDSDILSGTPVFVGTRVPVRSLFDYSEK